MTALSRIMDTDKGVFAVRTESSRYLVDTIERWLMRGPIEADASELRNDREPLVLFTIEDCEVGYSAVFLVKIPSTPAGTITMRRTTPVVEIEEVEL